MKAWQKLALGGTAALGLALVSAASCMIGYSLGERSGATPQPAAVEAPLSDPSHTPSVGLAPTWTSLPDAAPLATSTSAPMPARQPAVGEDVLVAEVRWRVLGVEQLGNRLTSENTYIEPATTMGQFVRVRFEVENRSPDSASFGGVEIVDSQGRSFKRSTGVLHWIPDSEQCLFETLNPNVPKICNFIFDVAADAAGLQLKVGDLKLFGNQEALIALGL